MRAVLMRTRKGAPSLPSNGCRCSRGRNACKDTPELLLRLPALSTSTAASGGVGISVRKRMMPLIKLVHPDMFGQYPPDVASTNSKSLKLRRQLDGLLRRASVGYDHGNAGGGNQETEDEQARRAIGDGVRVREGGTEEAFYGEAFGVGRRRRRGGAPRDGIRTERASRTTNRDQGDEPTITSEELRKLTIEHAGDNHHVDPWDAGAGSGFFGGGLGGGGGKGARRFGGAEASSQARSRRVDDLLRSGRVQFAGVPVSREAAALLRLHQTLVKHFEHLELHDRGLWSTVVLVLRARSESYEVQVHSGGPVLVFPEKFSERSLVRFLSEVLLSYT
ncbi:hypothetical protein Esi_0448_0010 [Ectocarpus siliculosus]|uniref:DUF4460 domain-containing protein n=1 Tax=Ectocarpus siliculosus TaxID=2880 RepID=D7G1D8_ECTSI|nr:hypothetical protein Esi_0448_0010 [Ectocarpus siliculosus]|eukprot:CBJ33248.1 hypothetical protein Esi_0448_0010 [Ectocarpus siliculosus]